MTCQENIHHLHGCQSMSDLPSLLSASCGPSLIIVEDLEESDFIRISRLEKMLLSVSQSRGLLVVITSRAGSNIINSRALEVSSELPVNRDKLEQDELVKLLLSSDVIPLVSDLAEYNIPVKLVPLLPLTRENVRECIHNILLDRKVVIKQLDVSAILDTLTFFSKELPVFSRLGCKPLAGKLYPGYTPGR